MQRAMIRCPHAVSGMSVRFAADAGNLAYMTDRATLVAIVQRVMDGDYANDDEVQGLVTKFEAAVPHPNAAGLIFWPSDHFNHEPTAVEVVEKALSYRAIELWQRHWPGASTARCLHVGF